MNNIFLKSENKLTIFSIAIFSFFLFVTHIWGFLEVELESLKHIKITFDLLKNTRALLNPFLEF